MERTTATTARIAAERTVRESLGDCPECGHDLPGVAKQIGGRWQLFCTECRICVIGPRDYAVKCWGLKEPEGALAAQVARIDQLITASRQEETHAIQ